MVAVGFASPTRPRLLALAACCALLGACKQGEGDRCEVTSDCKSGLECEALGVEERRCVTPGAPRMEPAPRQDAGRDLALPPDAPPEARAQETDARTDDAPGADRGALRDAAPPDAAARGDAADAGADL